MVSLLAGRALVFDYPGPLRAVDGVDLSVEPEEVLVLCGPNGSGKSTLLGLLGGLLAPAGGDVLLAGRPLGSLGLRTRARKLARVPQSLPSLPDVTVHSFVLGGRYAHIDRWHGPQRRDHVAVGYALAAADAEALDARPMAALSGGQRQRVLLARALAQEADVLLIDEPTAGLDPEHQIAVFELIAGLARNGRGVIVVTHDLNLASQFASSVALLQGGRLVTRGTPAEVLRPATLEPVYGRHLHYGHMPAPDGRPFVLPWRAADGPAVAGDGSGRDG